MNNANTYNIAPPTNVLATVATVATVAASVAAVVVVGSISNALSSDLGHYFLDLF